MTQTADPSGNLPLKKSPIEEAADAVDAAMGQLQGVLDDLTKRLEPVLTPAPEGLLKQPASEPSPARSSVVETFRAQEYNLKFYTGIVHDILNRLEV